VQPAVVARLFLSKLSLPPIRAFFALAVFSLFAIAATAQPQSSDGNALYLVDIELQTADEFFDLLQRAEQLLIEGAALPADEPKVSFVLHGPVLRKLLRDEYLQNKELVDLAASLTAMDVIELKACQTWMRLHGLEEARLLPFVQTVPYGSGAVKAMLESDNYTRF